MNTQPQQLQQEHLSSQLLQLLAECSHSQYLLQRNTEPIHLVFLWSHSLSLCKPSYPQMLYYLHSGIFHRLDLVCSEQ